MSEHEARKQANPPAGYMAVYGQSGIVYKPVKSTQSARKGTSPVFWLVLALVIVLALVVVFSGLTIWEDGSFRLFNLISGCLPGGLCN